MDAFKGFIPAYASPHKHALRYRSIIHPFTKTVWQSWKQYNHILRSIFRYFTSKLCY